MNMIDYVIIGVLVLASGIIVYRKIAGKSKGCSCAEEDCTNCPKKEKE